MFPSPTVLTSSPLTETVMQSIMAKILPCTVHEKQHISFGKSIKQQKEIKKSAFPAWNLPKKNSRLFQKHSQGWLTSYSLQPTSTEGFIAVRPIVTSKIIDTSKSSLRQCGDCVGDVIQKGDELRGHLSGGRGRSGMSFISVFISRGLDETKPQSDFSFEILFWKSNLLLNQLPNKLGG